MGRRGKRGRKAGPNERFAHLQGCQRHGLKNKAKTWLPERIMDIAGQVTQIMFWMSLLMTATMLAKLGSSDGLVFAAIVAGGDDGFRNLARQAAAMVTHKGNRLTKKDMPLDKDMLEQFNYLRENLKYGEITSKPDSTRISDVITTEVDKYIVNCTTNVTTNVAGRLKQWVTHKLKAALAAICPALLNRLDTDRKLFGISAAVADCIINNSGGRLFFSKKQTTYLDRLEADGLPPLCPIIHCIIDEIIAAHPVLVGARPWVVRSRWLEVLPFFFEMLQAADAEGEGCQLKRPLLLPLCKMEHRNVTLHTKGTMRAFQGFEPGMPCEPPPTVTREPDAEIVEIGRAYFGKWFTNNSKIEERARGQARFSASITSDGCSTLSYQLIKPAHQGYEAGEGEERKPEFYVDQKGDSRLPFSALPQGADGPSCSSAPLYNLTIIGNDPGRSNCITSVAKTVTSSDDLVAFGDLGELPQCALSTRQWRDEAGFNNIRHIKLKDMNNTVIHPAEGVQLEPMTVAACKGSFGTPRVGNLPALWAYVASILPWAASLFAYYRQPRIVRLGFRAKKQAQRAANQVGRRVLRLAPGEVKAKGKSFVFHGAAKITNKTKGMPAPNKLMKEMLAKHSMLIMVDEWGTSKRCSKCLEELVDLASVPGIQDGIQDQHRGHYNVRICPGPYCGSIYQRDTNAARNMLSLGTTAMLGLPRPAELRPKEAKAGAVAGEESEEDEQEAGGAEDNEPVP